MVQKYYKKDIYNLIENKREEVINKLRKETYEKIEEKELEILKHKGYLDIIEILQEDKEKLEKDIMLFVKELREDKDIEYHPMGYNSLEHNLYNSSKILNRILNSSELRYNNKDICKIRDNFDKECREINKNYKTVVGLVKSIKNTDKAAEELIKMGFDLTSIERKTEEKTNLPSININKLYLDKLEEKKEALDN